MSVLDIVIYPDKVLREKCEPVVAFDDALKTLVADMAETMYSASGVGLAANQVNVAKSVCIVDITAGEEPGNLHVFVNPEIIDKSDPLEWEEGCLSFPGIEEISVKRAGKIRVRAQNMDGESFEIDADQLMAVAIQHEMDHLHGVSLADKVSSLKRRFIVKDLKRIKKEREHH